MNQRRRHRPAALVITVAAVAFVFGPAAAGALGLRAEPLENRPLADPPSLSAGWKVFDESSAWVQDHLPVRNAAVEAQRSVARDVFSDAPTVGTNVVDGVAYPLVVQGRGEGDDQWLYFGRDFQNACHPSAGVERTVARLERLATLLRGAGKDVVVVVAPDKSSIVTDQLPERYLGRTCAAERKAQFWATYAGRDPDLVDLRPALRAADASPERAYLRSDSHWTPRGALATTRTLVDHLSPGTWRQDDVRPGPVFRKQGDLGTVRLEDRADAVPGFTLDRTGVTAGSTTLSGTYTYRVSNSAEEQSALVRGQTAWIGDSFTYTSRPQWSPWFERVTTRHRANTDRSLVLKDLVAADNVVYEVVERDAAAGSLGTVDDAFLDELEGQLAAAKR